GSPASLVDIAAATSVPGRRRAAPRARAGLRRERRPRTTAAAMTLEQVHQRVAQHHAARNARGGPQGAPEKAGATAAEHARLIAGRVLRRRRRVLRLRSRALVPDRRRLGRRRRLPRAAEQPGEEPAAGALLLLRRGSGSLMRLRQLLLQALDRGGGLRQRLLLHERGLCQPVARLGILGEQVADQVVRFGIHRRQRLAAPLAPLREAGRPLGAADPLDEAGDDVAFLVGHRIPCGSSLLAAAARHMAAMAIRFKEARRSRLAAEPGRRPAMLTRLASTADLAQVLGWCFIIPRLGLTLLQQGPAESGMRADAPSFQELILRLQRFWAAQGCVILQPYDVEMGAGTFHPATTLRALGDAPWRAAYVQPSRRPTDGRYGENPNRLQHYYQFQVIMKPSPEDAQELLLASYRDIGLDPLVHDFRFVEDDWESPTLGAWGLGWEIWLDGMEVSQFTYFQQVGGIECDPVSTELTYGLERLAMYVQGVESMFDLDYNGASGPGRVTYGHVFKRAEREFSAYNFEFADTARLAAHFADAEKECRALIDHRLALPAYDQCLKASHLFNLLDARGAISVTERAAYILRVRELAKACCETWLAGLG